MEPVMVPPRNEGSLEILPLKTTQYNNNNLKIHDVLPDRTLRLTIKSYDQLYSKEEQNNIFNEITMKYLREREMEQSGNGLKVDVAFVRAKQMILSCGVLPQELEIRDGGVFAKGNIEKSARYGPFQGKWAEHAQDQRFAWEVSQNFIKIILNFENKAYGYPCTLLCSIYEHNRVSYYSFKCMCFVETCKYCL